MRPFFARTGSKADMVRFLTDLEPKGYTKYIEPFVGGGSMYWSKADCNIQKIINDIHCDLITGYRLLQSGNLSNLERFNTRDMDQLNTIYNYQGDDESCKLAQLLVRFNNTFGSNGRGKLYKPTNPYFKLKNIEKYRETIKNTDIRCEDYLDVINEHDCKDAFIFLDPPYVSSSSGMYKHDTINMAQLHSCLSNIQGKFLLTLDNIETNRELFKDFKQVFRTVIGKGRAKGGMGTSDRVDLIIMNY